MPTIEKAKREDFASLLELVRKQFDEHAIHYEAKECRSAVETAPLNEELGLFILAKEGHAPIGFAAISFAWTLEHGGKSAWLDELYVLPSHRGRSIGSALLESVFVEVEAAGCQAIDLEVDEEHRQAERLYTRKGFKALKRSRWVKPLS